ncbi:O-antigen polymerase [Paenibacillus sp. BR2-3]|uniref:O-antigen polymerase n=1 Tax=Paenibacillus sp. BR2-3 TaxID=3048494 RepID=UPI0039779772
MNIYIYLKVSKLNKSYVNSYLNSTGVLIFIQTMPLVLYILRNDIGSEYSDTTLITFIITLFVSSIFSYIGYKVGFSKSLNIDVLKLNPSSLGIRLILVFSFVFALISFGLLGYKGVGIYTWITNNRYAYIIGRSGLGVYYVIFQLMIIAFVTSVLFIKASKSFKIICILIIILFSYFTGSKGFLLALIISLLFFYDMFVKKLTYKKILIIALLFILSFKFLLSIQSQMSIFDYAGKDFYQNYLMLLNAFFYGNLEHFNGKLLLEDFLWSLVPRNIYSEKPFIYGHSTLVAFFYGEQTVINGSTPSFTALGVPFADFGTIGVLIISITRGFFQGMGERSLRNLLWENGPLYMPYFLYIILFVFSIPSFSTLYLLFISMIFILFIRLFYRRRK